MQTFSWHSRKLWARVRRNAHCILLLFADMGHRKMDLYLFVGPVFVENNKLKAGTLVTQLIRRSRRQELARMSCKCGRIFWDSISEKHGIPYPIERPIYERVNH